MIQVNLSTGMERPIRREVVEPEFSVSSDAAVKQGSPEADQDNLAKELQSSRKRVLQGPEIGVRVSRGPDW
jgi:hypothetical protein